MPAFTVVFNLDGTLVDTAPDLVATLNVVLAREGLAPLPYEAARNMVGGGARRMSELGLKAEGRTLAARDVDRMGDECISHYTAHSADQSRPFAGLSGALDARLARNPLRRMHQQARRTVALCSTRSASARALRRSAAKTRLACTSQIPNIAAHNQAGRG